MPHIYLQQTYKFSHHNQGMALKLEMYSQLCSLEYKKGDYYYLRTIVLKGLRYWMETFLPIVFVKNDFLAPVFFSIIPKLCWNRKPNINRPFHSYCLTLWINQSHANFIYGIIILHINNVFDNPRWGIFLIFLSQQVYCIKSTIIVTFGFFVNFGGKNNA